MSDRDRSGNPLWSRGLGHSSIKWEASGSTPTGGAFTFLSLIKECSKELFIIFIESNTWEIII